MIRVLLADDQALVRGALAAVLRLEPDIEVAAEIGTGTEVLAAAQRTLPDIALLDVQIPGRDRLTVAADLQRALPGCRTIICATFSRHGYLSRAIPHYWRLEFDPAPRLITCEPDGGRYVETATALPGTVTRIDEPFPFDIDPAGLAQPQHRR
ncbi:response regulator [Streptomyces chattanoogensis]|uniref:response regulator n=1 Tax=Streptomyces chattanoogensis TaxID=66876 RepID=UPI0036B8B2DD